MASEEQFDAVAAAQAQAQAIAAKFAQQQAAGEGAAGGEDFGNNKRKFEDEPVADSTEEDHMRKRASFSGPEAFNGVCASSLVLFKPVDLCMIDSVSRRNDRVSMNLHFAQCMGSSYVPISATWTYQGGFFIGRTISTVFLSAV